MTSLTKLSRSVKNMVTLITGAGSGMGRATAKVFADAGAKVIVSDINEQNVIEVTNEILKEKKICSGYVLDITSKGEIENVIEKVIKEFGQLDHLINNAGIAIPLSIDDENYEESWAFLDRRLEDVMRVGRAKANLQRLLPSPQFIANLIKPLIYKVLYHFKILVFIGWVLSADYLIYATYNYFGS